MRFEPVRSTRRPWWVRLRRELAWENQLLGRDVRDQVKVVISEKADY